MKPKTELQKQIVKLSGKLPALTEKQRRWGIMNAMDHVGLRLKKGLITCTHCGKIFYDLMKLEDGEMDICPNCGTHLKIETTTRKSCRDNEYFNIITTCHGFQVFRYFYIRKEFHSGKEASYCIEKLSRTGCLPMGNSKQWPCLQTCTRIIAMHGVLALTLK